VLEVKDSQVSRNTHKGCAWVSKFLYFPCRILAHMYFPGSSVSTNFEKDFA